ncbi:MAG: diguanylate cyclase [Treponema sp.]|jgi:diguanylate cyclase (GGDEF)-like protein|nr:diguanylate cyclase [Treponema sp.]
MTTEQQKKHSVIIIDYDIGNFETFNTILDEEYYVFVAPVGSDAVDVVRSTKPDVILLNISLHNIDGFDILKKLKGNGETQNIPVVALSNNTDSEIDEERCFLLGVSDYIKSPFKPAVVRARMRTHMQIIQQKYALEHVGMIDWLTNIPNRRCFDGQLYIEWKRARRDKKPLSFLMMDVDLFKSYNDRYGHPQGDTLLKSVAKVFKKAVRRPADLCARLGGEEFGILLPETSLEPAVSIAEEVRKKVKALQVPTANRTEITSVTISIGVSTMIPDGSNKVEELMAEADRNLYVAKNAGRDQVYAGKR